MTLDGRVTVLLSDRSRWISTIVLRTEGIMSLHLTMQMPSVGVYMVQSSSAMVVIQGL
jgi:hypothetical protein